MKRVEQKPTKTFHVEVELTNEALELISLFSGMQDVSADAYNHLQSKILNEVIPNKTTQLLGLGSDLNEIISIGLMTIAKIKGIELSPEGQSISSYKTHSVDFEVSNVKYERYVAIKHEDTL